ncbi:MAG: DNA polymerase I, partial [Desulfobacterota bacterium]|nr:DNA polymerase I [Thermodesulfobacteriota bacterium]
MSLPPQLYLIDGSSNIYRAYFALKNLSNSKGFPTNAIYGFTAMLVKILRDFHPEYLGIVFDAKGPTFRHHLYNNYKATRPGMPDDLSLQLPYIKGIVRGFGINTLELEGYEADDVIGTTAKKASSAGIPTIIVSGDKDLLQLVDERITIFDPRTNKTFGIKEVEERFGVTPDKVAEVLGLSGDPTDNIPGVAGIGEKTATKLIQKYHSIAEVYAHLEELSDSNLKNKLKEGYDQAFLSKELVTINTSLPLPFDLKIFQIGKPDFAVLEPIFKELEFSRFLKEFIPRKSPIIPKYQSISTPDEFQDFVLTLNQVEEFSFVISKDSPDIFKANITGFAFSLPEGKTFWIPLTSSNPNSSGLDILLVLPALKSIFEDVKIKKCGYNIKTESLILVRQNIMLRGEKDILLGAYLLNPSKKNYEIKEIAFEYLDYPML